jgi:hypothetical protein
MSPRGGARVGAGRKKGSTKIPKQYYLRADIIQVIARIARRDGISESQALTNIIKTHKQKTP